MKSFLLPLLLTLSLSSAYADTPADVMTRKYQNWQSLKNSQSPLSRPDFRVNDYDNSVTITNVTRPGTGSGGTGAGGNGSGGTGTGTGTGTSTSPTPGTSPTLTPPNNRTGLGDLCGETVCTNPALPNAGSLVTLAERLKNTTAARTALVDLPNPSQFVSSTINAQVKGLSSADRAIVMGYTTQAGTPQSSTDTQIQTAATYQEYLSRNPAEPYSETYWALVRSMREKTDLYHDFLRNYPDITLDQAVDVMITFDMFKTFDQLKVCKVTPSCLYA